jgi:hypothetical protein
MLMVLRATSATSAKYTINIFLYRSSKFFESTILAQEGKVMGNRANLIKFTYLSEMPKMQKREKNKKGEETLKRRQNVH